MTVMCEHPRDDEEVVEVRQLPVYPSEAEQEKIVIEELEKIKAGKIEPKKKIGEGLPSFLREGLEEAEIRSQKKAEERVEAKKEKPTVVFDAKNPTESKPSSRVDAAVSRVSSLNRRKPTSGQEVLKTREHLSDEQEKALILQAGNKDTPESKEAFGKLYEAYIDRIFRHFYYRTESKEIAEDLASIVFIRAWRKIEKFKYMGQNTFKTWLFSIAHNLLVDHYRASKEELPIYEAINADEQSDPQAHAERVFENAELRQAIAGLGRDKQVAVVMRYINRLDYSDIASFLNKREGAVRVILHRALLDLRETLSSDTREAISSRSRKKIIESAREDDGLTYYDLAIMLGISVNSVIAKISKARASDHAFEISKVHNGARQRVFQGEEKEAVLKFFGLKV